MMKKIFIIAVMIFSMVTLRAYNENLINVDSIVVKYAPWHIMTPSDVTCSNFENHISYKEYHVSDNIVISDVVREIESLKESNGHSLNVRCKIYFYSQGQVIASACIDPQHVLFDGVLYLLSPSLKTMIDSVIRNNIPQKNIKNEILTPKDIPFPNGRDSLYAYLMPEVEKVGKKISKTIALTVNCFIDRQGNTLKVDIKYNSTPDDNNKIVIEKLNEIFMNDIKWIPDKERFPYDVISIPLRFYIEQK